MKTSLVAEWLHSTKALMNLSENNALSIRRSLKLGQCGDQNTELWEINIRNQDSICMYLWLRAIPTKIMHTFVDTLSTPYPHTAYIVWHTGIMLQMS